MIQSIERGAAIMRLVAKTGYQGARVKDLAAETGLIPSTINRLCKTLVKEGWLFQPIGQKRYFVGAAPTDLSTMSSDRAALLNSAEMGTARLAKLTDDTIYFFVRDGMDLLCSHRQEGNFAIRTLPINVGSWVPLGLGYAGIAILSTLDEDEFEVLLDQLINSRRDVRNLDQTKLRQDVSRARRLRYADVPREGRMPPGAGGIAAPILSPMGRPIAAISLLTIEERLSNTRVSEMAQLLLSECAQIGREILTHQETSPIEKSLRAGMSD